MVKRDEQVADFAFVDQSFDRTRSNFLSRLSNHITSRRIDQIILRPCSTNTFWEKFCDPAFMLAERKIYGVKIRIHNTFLIHAQRIEKCCHRQFPTPVDTCKNDIFRIEFKIKPRAAIRNDTTCKKQFSRAMRFAFVVVEKYTR